MITADIQELISPELPAWGSVVPVRLLGRDVRAVVAHVADEQRRRAACGLGALDDSDLLRVLFRLPVGMPVPSVRLDRWERKVLGRSPQGAAELSRDTVTRLASPPVRVELVVVRARGWERGIFWASQYGPFCRRVLVLSSPPPTQRDRDGLELEARMFGIGVVISGQADDGWLVEPAPFRPQRMSSGQWLFQERAWAAMLESGHAPGHQGSGLGVVEPVLQDWGERHFAVDINRQLGVRRLRALEFFAP